MERNSHSFLDHTKTRWQVSNDRVSVSGDSAANKKAPLPRPRSSAFNLAEASPEQIDMTLRSSEDAREFKHKISRYLQSIGITHFSHANFTKGCDVLDPFGTVPEALSARFVKDDFHSQSLIHDHLMLSGKALFNSAVDAHVESAGYEAEVFRHHEARRRLLSDFDIYDIYNLPVRVGCCTPGLLSLWIAGAEPKDLQEVICRHQEAIHLLAVAINEIGRGFKDHFHNRRKIPRVPISPRQLALVAALTKDLTLNEAAEVCSISISTANQHIAAAKKALGANTTHGLIQAARDLGLLS
jgi:DNA-binding CsgD family transcriptional regulator